MGINSATSKYNSSSPKNSSKSRRSNGIGKNEDGDTEGSQRRLRKRANLDDDLIADGTTSPKKPASSPNLSDEGASPKADDLNSPDKRPPVKLTVKFKEGRKPCQVHVVNTSLSTAEPPNKDDDATQSTIPTTSINPVSDLAPSYYDVMMDELEKDVLANEPENKHEKEPKPLNPEMTPAQLIRAINRLDHQDGEVSTSLLSDDGKESKTNSTDPPKVPQVVLTKEELSPPTPCVFVKTKAEAFSPQLFELCLQRPIVLIRNLAPVCNIDMSLYGTKTLVERHPNHPVEIRSQVEQSADENWDANFEKRVWYCTSSRSHTTISKYAEYQAAGLEDAYQEALVEVGGKPENIDMAKMINPPEKPYAGERKMLKFGTNCDLSDTSKWGPQLKELDKLPAWVRVVSAGNMLSHLGHQILGMNTVQLYMKVPRARTPGHQENNNFCAVNLNVGPGDSEWFGVPNDYWGGLQNICKKNKVDFLHGSWWPLLPELHEAGIPVYRFMQKPGDLVWVNTGCVHWVQAAGWCNNIAWNVGPLTSHQYKVAIERYEWNKTQKYQSIVAMVFLSWNLARNVCLSNEKLFWQIKYTLMQSIRQTVQTLNLARSKGLKIRFHGHRSHESAHYCGVCDEEVFNVLLIKESEKRHVVHCLKCASHPSTGGKDLKGIIALVEYPLKELLRVYDNFKLIGPSSKSVKQKTSFSLTKTES